MGRIWQISDIHFGVRGNSLEWLDNHIKYFDDFFIPLLKEHKKDKDILFILGDIFDNRQTINVLIQNKAIEIIEKISKIIDIYMIVGNHDLYYKNQTDVNSLKCFVPYVKKIYETPEFIKVNGKKIFIMPWVGNFKEESDLLKTAEKKGADYVFCHSEFYNQPVSRFRSSEEGVTDYEDTKIKKIVSGHIHGRFFTEKLIYLGCPLPLTRIDMDVKGIYCLDLETDDFLFFENDVSPKFIQISYSELLEMDAQEIEENIKNNYVDVFLTFEENNSISYAKMDEMLKEAKQIHYELTDRFITENIEFDSDIESDSENNFNLFQMLDVYIDKNVKDTDNNLRIKNKIKEIRQNLGIQE